MLCVVCNVICDVMCNVMLCMRRDVMRSIFSILGVLSSFYFGV